MNLEKGGKIKMKKLGVILALVFFVGFIFFSSQAEAATAVTIEVTNGPALTEGKLTSVDLIVPERPPKAMPLNIGEPLPKLNLNF